MGNRKSFFASAACLLVAAGAFAQTTNQTPAYTVKTIYQFPPMGPPDEGVNPQGLILGLDGSFYGTTGGCQISIDCAGRFLRLSLGGNSPRSIRLLTPRWTQRRIPHWQRTIVEPSTA